MSGRARRSPAEEVGGDENDNLPTYSEDGNMMSFDFEVETVPILPPILHQVYMPAQVSQANDNHTFDNDEQEGRGRVEGM